MIIKIKKSQSETVGFVLIIIIVAVIGLAFLYFILTAPAKQTSSVKISSLLQASMHYTSNCSVIPPNYKSGKELISSCFTNPNDLCDDGRTFCKALNDSFKSILSESLRVGEDVPIKGYRLRMYFNESRTEEPEKVILYLEQGRFANCTERYGGGDRIYSGSGSIEVRLEICERNIARKSFV